MKPDTPFLLLWIRIGLMSFGGPAGQIALMREEIVSRRGWVSEDAFQRGLDVAMLLPGPEAQQLATWLGWRSAGVKGALISGLSFILPGAALMILLAWLAATQGETRWVSALFYGIQPAVIVIVAMAMVKLARRALPRAAHLLVAGVALAALMGGVTFPIVIATAALAGLLILPSPEIGEDGLPELDPDGRGKSLRVLGVGATLLGLGYLVAVALGADPYLGVANLFTSAALVSFGGAYALLPYVAEHAVETNGWLTAEQMLNGLALGESTPGPLILVNLYAGFFGGFQSGGAGAGVIAAVLTCYFTFLPSITLMLAAAPHVEPLGRFRQARAALAGVSAAVVGVIASLAIYLAEAALLPLGLEAPEWPKIALLAVFIALVAWRQMPLWAMIGGGALAGLALGALNVI